MQIKHKKQCNRCLRIRHVRHFRLQSKHWGSTDPQARRQSSCKDCENEYRRKYRKTTNGLLLGLVSKLNRHYGAKITIVEMRKLGPPIRCYLCGRKIKSGFAELDHIVSRRAKGPTQISNLKWTHKRCNRMKHDLSITQFVKRIKRILAHLNHASSAWVG